MSVELSLSQIRDAWRIMCGASPGEASEDLDGLSLIFSGLPIPFFNLAVVNGGDLSADALRSHADAARQRRGYADAAMRRALEAAAEVHGELPTVLHATDAGRPVYERMGYAAISTHTFFIEKAFLAGH